MYKKVLLTLDGSELSEMAVPHAAQIATSAGAEVVLMRVTDSVAHIMAQSAPTGFEVTSGAVTAEIAQEAVAAQRASAEQEMQAVADRLKAQGVGAVSLEIAEGSPGDAIVDAAARLGCDLIVMATHGRSGLGRALLGSVADHVVRHARAAILLVRPPHQS